MPDDFILVVLNRAVGQNFAQNGVLTVDDVVVVVDAPDDVARFVVSAQGNAPDDAPVQIKHRAVANDAPDDFAGGIAHQTVGKHDTQHRIALLRIHVVIHEIRGGFQLPEHLVRGIVDQAVGIRRADDFAIVGNDFAVFVRLADERAERIVRFRSHGGFDGKHFFALRVLPDDFSGSVQHFAGRGHIADDVAVRVHNRFADGDDFADFASLFVENAVGHIGVTDDVAVQIDDRAVRQSRPDDFAVFADDLTHAHEHAPDRRAVFIDDASVRQLQIAQKFGFLVQSDPLRQNTPDNRHGSVENRHARGNDARDFNVFCVFNVAGADDASQTLVAAQSQRFAAFVAAPEQNAVLIKSQTGGKRRSQKRGLAPQHTDQTVRAQTADGLALLVDQFALVVRIAQILVPVAQNAAALDNTSDKLVLIVENGVIILNVSQTLHARIDDAPVGNDSAQRQTRHLHRVGIARHDASDFRTRSVNDDTVGEHAPQNRAFDIRRHRVGSDKTDGTPFGVDDAVIRQQSAQHDVCGINGEARRIHTADDHAFLIDDLAAFVGEAFHFPR